MRANRIWQSLGCDALGWRHVENDPKDIRESANNYEVTMPAALFAVGRNVCPIQFCESPAQQNLPKLD